MSPTAEMKAAGGEAARSHHRADDDAFVTAVYLAMRALDPEVAELRRNLAEANRAADAEMERVKACEHIACGDLGWPIVRNLCPSAAAVAELRDAYEATTAFLASQGYARAEDGTWGKAG